MLKQISPTAGLVALTQGRDETIQLSIKDSAGAVIDLSGESITADFTLYEKIGDASLDYLTSSGLRINLLDGAAFDVNVELLWTQAQSAAILADSIRPGGVALIGQLRIFLSTLPTISRTINFNLIQFRVGS